MSLASPLPAAARPVVLVVDDDELVRRALARSLELEGFDVEESIDGEEAVDRFDPDRHDAVVVDLLMPRASGVSVVNRLRACSTVPMIVMSSHDDEVSRVVALEAGADDFVAKPVSSRELSLRLQNALRARRPPADEVIEHGELRIEPATRRVTVAGHLIELTAKELDLLLVLARSPERVFSRAELLRAVWDSQPAWQSVDTVTEHMYRLRHKVEADPQAPRHLRTVRGAGYRFSA